MEPVRSAKSTPDLLALTFQGALRGQDFLGKVLRRVEAKCGSGVVVSRGCTRLTGLPRNRQYQHRRLSEIEPQGDGFASSLRRARHFSANRPSVSFKMSSVSSAYLLRTHRSSWMRAEEGLANNFFKIGKAASSLPRAASNASQNASSKRLTLDRASPADVTTDPEQAARVSLRGRLSAGSPPMWRRRRVGRPSMWHAA